MRILIVIYFMINWDDWDYFLLHERVFKKFKSSKFHKTASSIICLKMLC